MRKIIAKIFNLVDPNKYDSLKAELKELKKRDSRRKRLAKEAQARYRLKMEEKNGKGIC